MSVRVSDYSYDLPEELIATRPLLRRDASRMLVVDRAAGVLSHCGFHDFSTLLRVGDMVALNNSKVIKARLLAPERNIEIFLLEQTGPKQWKCLVKPGRKLRAGTRVEIAGTTAAILDVLPGGERIVEFRDVLDLEKFGHIPLPPYFRRESDSGDDERYQTVYADPSGSVAAPTAGLHFTPGMLAAIPHTFLTLHVGAGTFLPVKCEVLADHPMHEESYGIPAKAAEALNAARRIVAVGTTVTRVLESQPPGPLGACGGRTDIFIHPPFEFRRTGALLTNFHLPRSTLLMLVCAFGGYELVMRAYAEAIRERYRFYSYGDCMLLV